ncbi:MAG: hypothetical protein RR921_07450 [Mucinivorans sp.]
MRLYHHQTAANIDSDGRCSEKHLYFVADPDTDLPLEVVYHICSAVQIAFGDSLVWDIVTELPEPLRAEDGIMAYLYTSQCKL